MRACEHTAHTRVCASRRSHSVSSGPLGIMGCRHTVTGTASAFLPEFEEPRVIDLWDLAKSSNFTEKELESFRVRKVLGEAGSRYLATSLLFNLVLTWERLNRSVSGRPACSWASFPAPCIPLPC